MLAVVREASPIVTALLIAGAGGSAICADLGSRKIRDEIDAMEVLGITPIQRLVVPRVLAAMLVAVLLNGLVSVVGVAGGYFFNVILQGGTPGAYLASFTALAQLPDLWTGEIKALIFGLIAGDRRVLQGPDRRRRAEGRRRRGEPVGGHHLHAAVRRQLRPHRRSTSRSSRRRSEGGCRHRARSHDLRRSPRRRRLDGLGEPAAASTSARSAGAPRTLRRYKKEVMRLLAEVTFGTGALAVIGGTVGVIAFLAFFTGTEVGLQGYAALNQLGTGGVHRLHLGLLQHPRDRAAGRRPRAVGHRRLRLHRAARRDADQRGDRRPRGDGRARRCRSW